MQEHAEGPGSEPLQMCHHCGATLAPDATVCPKCGTAQEKELPPKSDEEE